MTSMGSIRVKVVTAVVLTLAAIGLGVVNVADRLQWKQASDGFVWRETAHGLKAVHLLEPPLTHPPSELAEGDLLLSINGITIQSRDDYTEVVELLAETLPEGTPATYSVRRADTGEAISHPVYIAWQTRFERSDIFLMILAAGFLGMGLFILLRNFRARGAFHFYLICLVAFILFLFRHSGRADLFDLVIYWSSATAFLLLPPLFLHFCCYFPEALSRLRPAPQLKTVLYLPSLFLLGAHIAWFTGNLRPLGLPRTPVIAQFIDSVHLLHFVTFFVLAALVLVFMRRESALVVERQQVKWIVRGTVIGLTPFTLFYAIPYLLGWPIRGPMEVSVLSLLLLPLSFAYAITKYRLMDVELIFKRGLAYVLASSALLGLYVGLMLVGGKAVQDVSPESGFVLFMLAALVIAFLFAPLKNAIQVQIDRYFYKEAFDYRHSFADFAGTLSSEMSLPRLTEKISNRIRKTLNVSPVAIFLREDAASQEYHLYHALELPPEKSAALSKLEAGEGLFSDYDRLLRPLLFSPNPEREPSFRTRLAELGLHYVQLLSAHGRVIGFLALGKRDNEDFLSSEDLELISTLAGYASIAIDNAILYRSLEAKAAELAQLKVYNEHVIESISVGVAVITPEGEITVWNNTLQGILGLNSTEVLGRNISEVLPEDLIEAMKEVVEGPRWVVEDTAHLYKTHLKAAREETRLVNITFSPFIMQDNMVTGTLLVFDDVTDNVRLESQLLQAEKLSSIGLFAAGVAHEVNTPLAAISSYTQMLLKDTPHSNPSRELLAKIEKQSFRASNIVNKLLNFARFDETDFQEVNLNALMLETLSLLDHQLKKNKIEVVLELDPSLPSTVGNGGKLQQVFMNLFLNARDAMNGGGVLRLRTQQQNSTVVVQVADTGTGISKENVKRIYDPFFTTKEVGKGTGLGLSVSYGIIQEHSGRIGVASEPGLGTTFTVHFPIKRVH